MVLVGRLVAMDSEPDNLELLRREWRRISVTSDSRRAAATLRQRHGERLFTTAHHLGDIVAGLEQRSGYSVHERARGVTVLLAESGDPIVRRALLQTLLPGVVSACRQLRFGDGIVASPSICLNEALALLCELLVDWAGQERPYAAPDLVSALRGRLRRWLLKEKEFQAQLSRDRLPEIAVEPSTLLTRLDRLRRDPHHQRLAELVWQQIMGGVPLYQLARADHRSTTALQAELVEFARTHLL